MSFLLDSDACFLGDDFEDEQIDCCLQQWGIKNDH